MGDLNISSFLFRFNVKTVLDAMTHYLYTLTSYKDIKIERLYIFPSAKCDDACIYCEKRDTINRVGLFENRHFIDRLITDIKKLEIKEIHLFGGGEPFFYKDNMFYFLEGVKNLDTFIKIITNGNNLNDEDVRRIVKDGLISHLGLNLNTDSREMAHNIYLKEERHSHTLSVLESFSKYKKLYNTQFPFIDMMFVLFNMNYDKIPNILYLLKKFDVNFFFIQPLRILTKYHNNLKLSEEQKNEFVQMLPYIEKIMDELNIRSNINDFKINKNLIEDSESQRCVVPNRVLFGRSKLACYIPLTTLAIYSDGTIPKCIYLNETYASNYFSLSSLRDFILGKEFIEFLMKFIGTDEVSPCKDCTMCLLCEIEEIRKGFCHLKRINAGI